jgi:hypothetical protein
LNSERKGIGEKEMSRRGEEEIWKKTFVILLAL